MDDKKKWKRIEADQSTTTFSFVSGAKMQQCFPFLRSATFLHPTPALPCSSSCVPVVQFRRVENESIKTRLFFPGHARSRIRGMRRRFDGNNLSCQQIFRAEMRGFRRKGTDNLSFMKCLTGSGLGLVFCENWFPNDNAPRGVLAAIDLIIWAPSAAAPTATSRM